MRNKKEPKNREISIIPPFFTRFVKTYLNILGFKLKKEALNDLIRFDFDIHVYHSPYF